MTFPSVLAALAATPDASYGASNYAPSISALGAVSGNRLIAIITCSVGAQRNYPTPSGWTQIGYRFGNSDTEVYVYQRTATGTDSFTLVKTGGSSAASGVVYCIGGYDTGKDAEVSSVGLNNVNCNPPSLSPSWGAQDTLWIAAGAANVTTVGSFPTNYDTDQRVSVEAGAGPLTAAATRQNNTATEDPGPFGFGGLGYSQAWTISICGATGGGSSTTLTASQGSFTLSGQVVTLPVSRTFSAVQGSFALTGQAAAFISGWNLSADQGSFALTGQNVALTLVEFGNYLMSADVGIYTFAGNEAYADISMNAVLGSHALTGQDISFTLQNPYVYSMTITAGAYTYTGRSARLVWSGAPIVPNRQAGIYMGMGIGL